MYNEIKKCRVCSNTNLEIVLDLGEQELTGVFPSSPEEQITRGPMQLVKCTEDSNECCGLLQLKQSFPLDEMYGDNYGYRSGLNKSMVKHLHESVRKIQSYVDLSEDDIVLDIGSNDSTLLQAYPKTFKNLIGIDPTGKKFKEFYPAHIKLVDDFFSKDNFEKFFPSKKAKVVTSFSMFYDLEDPLGFVKQIDEILDDNGIWVFEQSYMPTMVEKNSFDTVCHEHLEYYGLRQIEWMLNQTDLRILDVTFNDVNGGSFCVIATKKSGTLKSNHTNINSILQGELDQGYNTLKPYLDFKARIEKVKGDFLSFLNTSKENGELVVALGASTKGNVLLQYCNVTPDLIPYVLEVNEYKFNKFTPGTHLPIISEEEGAKLNIAYKVVLPWHFRDFFLEKERDFLNSGKKIVFPFPNLEIISGDNA